MLSDPGRDRETVSLVRETRRTSHQTASLSAAQNLATNSRLRYSNVVDPTIDRICFKCRRQSPQTLEHWLQT